MDIPELNRLERREFDMHLTWSDGTEHEVTYDDLRHACPCAKCAPQRNDDESSKDASSEYYSTIEKDLAVVNFYFGNPTTMGMLGSNMFLK